MSEHKNWELKFDGDNIAWLTFDRVGETANTLNQESIDNLNIALDRVKDKNPKGLVIKSGKANGFIFGADVSEFKIFETEDDVKKVLANGQGAFDKLENLPFPTVALINGLCLGGGLELVLACDYRIFSNHPKARLGLPEVMLGIHPGWGGTVRLPKLIGIPKGMELILSGRTLVGKVAKKYGIVDECIDLRYFEKAALHYINTKPAKHKPPKWDQILNFQIVRRLLAKMLQRQVAKKANPKHYPAPYAVIDNFADYGISEVKGYDVEIDSICKLATGDTARNLGRVFFLRERLKGLAKSQDSGVKHVHVIGAGVMGGDIAAWCALRGFKVTLEDTNLNAIAATFGRAQELYKKKLKLPYLIMQAKDNLNADAKGLGRNNADLVIEAIVENLEAKQGLFKSLETQVKSDCILATNTSTIPLDKIKTAMQDKSRLIGIHFFNPVSMMPLVEVVHDNSPQDILDRAMSFVGKIDKLPLPVKSAPGFLVNRALMPYLLESIALLEEGIPGPAIDKAAKDFGMPMGPVELADTVGLDVCIHAAKSLGADLPEKVNRLVEAGHLGKKTGRGFYKYKKGKPIYDKSDKNAVAPYDTADRLIMRMINEAVSCLREGIVEDEELLDAGMIFGTGFAPFLGGPMNYVKLKNKADMAKRMDELKDRYGSRFMKDAGWAV